MKKLIFILLITCQFLSSQNIDNFSKQDTLYYYFKNNKNENHSGLKLFSPPNRKSIKYYVAFEKASYYFYYLTHKKVDKEIIKIPVIIKNKKLLKNNNAVLSYCKLKKLNSKELESLFWKNKNKVIYLIDKKENKKGKIFLRRVNWASSYLIKQ